MAVAFPALDKRLSRGLGSLHDYLWVPGWKGDEEELRTGLLAGAKGLDAFLGARGRLTKIAASLAKPWSRDRQGVALFELLHNLLGLAAATEHVRKGKYREAALRAQRVVESTSIGMCSAAKCFEIVEEWEARKIDFEAYTGRLADVLESRFILQAGQFKRVLNAVNDFGTDWDASASKTEQMLAARATIENAAWCVTRSVSIRAMLGDAPRVPEKDQAALLAQIVSRL